MSVAAAAAVGLLTWHPLLMLAAAAAAAVQALCQLLHSTVAPEYPHTLESPLGAQQTAASLARWSNSP